MVRLFRHLSPLLRGLGTALCIQAAVRWITSVLFWCFCISPFCFTSCLSPGSFPSRLLFSDPVWLHLTFVGVKHLPMPYYIMNTIRMRELASPQFLCVSICLHFRLVIVTFGHVGNKSVFLSSQCSTKQEHQQNQSKWLLRAYNKNK